MSVVSFCHRHSRAILFTLAVLAASGVLMMLNLPVSLFPDVTFPRIVILADNGEQPAERMMVEVTKPLEEVATAIPGVRYVRSITSRGSSEISIGLDWGSDIQQTLGLVQGRIANIRNELPPTAAVQAEQMTVAVFPIACYSLTSDSLSLVALRDVALYQIRPALLRVPGVARVEVTGGDTREFLVSVDPARLALYHLTVGQVSDAVAQTNFIASTGLINDNYRMYLSLVSGITKTTSEVGEIVITVRDGVPVRIRDVAAVGPGIADQYIRTTAHGRDAVLINILKQPTGSTVRIGTGINDVVSHLKLPKGILFENFYDQGDFISGSIAGVRDSMLVGIILAMLIVWLFLRSWRLTLVILIIVPTAIAITFLALGALGKTINIMTLGGIAAAVGLIIDDSIVIIEYMFTRFALLGREGRTRAGIVSSADGAIRSLLPAVIGSTASTIVIHIPLAFLGGITGAFFASLSITMVCALLISFILSITLAPLLAAGFLRDRDIEREISREHRPTPVESFLERIPVSLMKRRWLTVPLVIAVLAGSYALYLRLGSGFLPEMDEGTFVLDYNAPPGTSLAETHRILNTVEQILMETPEVGSYSLRTGTQLGFFITEPNSGDFLVKLKAQRSRPIEEVIGEVRDRVREAEPSLQIEFGQLMMDVIGDLTNNPSPIEIKFFGEQPEVLRTTAKSVKALIDTIPGVVDAFDGIVISGPSLVIRVDSRKAALAGFTPQEIADQVSGIMAGRSGTAVQHGEKMIAVHVRYPDAYRNDLRRISGLRIVNAKGNQVPLVSVAEITRTTGEAEIDREQLQQMVAVTARLSGRDLGSTMADIQAAIASHIALPPRVTVEYGGIYQTQQESFSGLVAVALAAVLLVVIVLLFEFGEFRIPLTIFIINAMSLLGVFGALWLTGTTVNVSSLVGIILIIGIVAENAIFIFHLVPGYIAEGSPPDLAVIRALRVRIRPILMTTLAAVLALLPLTIGLGAGSQMQKPLAIAVIGGFSVSSLLLFIALPPLYALFHREKSR